MAAVGTLAAGVAHEINNPLAYIVANIDFARHQINTVASRLSRSAVAGGPAHVLDETGEALTEARQGAERVRNIVRDLRVFARGDDDQSGPVAIRRVLDSSINIAWNEIRHRARLVKDYGETPLVEGNESRLGQVFLNLLLNAAHAIPEGETERNEIRVTHPHGRPRLRDRRGARQRHGDSDRDPRADLRSVLHDQAGRRGDRAGPLDLPRHRQRAGRRGEGRQRDRARAARSA